MYIKKSQQTQKYGTRKGSEMIIIKGWYHFMALVQRLFFFFAYGSRIKIGKGTTWRRGFSVMKDNEAFILIGKDCFFNNDCSINANHYIKIGGGIDFWRKCKNI